MGSGSGTAKKSWGKSGKTMRSFLVAKTGMLLAYQKADPSWLPRRRASLVAKKEILLGDQVEDPS